MQKVSNAKNSFGKKRSTSTGGYWIKERRKPRPFRTSSRASSSPRPHSSRQKSNDRRFSEKIDISRMIQKSVSSIPKEQTEVKNSFNDFGLVSPLNENLKKRNFFMPTPIQDQSIPAILGGRDLVGLANTGTGKTAAFLLPLINKVFGDRSQNVLIVAPTRELAIQIEQEFRQFSWGMRIFSGICVGGSPIYKQINNLRRDPNFVIGTPGRLKDLAERGIIKFAQFQNVVVDEVDRMMDMGFIDDIKEILSTMPKERQSLFFSATLPFKIKNLISDFSNNPIFVEVKTGQASQNVDQDVIRVLGQEMKFGQLQELLASEEVAKALVFIETKAEVDKITMRLVDEGFRAESIHGDKKQSQRQRALNQFRSDRVNILVATDVAARGLDIKDITHVINYTVPQTYDDYIHRVGRAGRGNNKGKAFTFVG